VGSRKAKVERRRTDFAKASSVEEGESRNAKGGVPTSLKLRRSKKAKVERRK
jgi:hypothetical protein